MFNKRSRTEKAASADIQRTRVITTSFSGQGICGRAGEVWIIEAGVPMPQALEQNSVEYSGTVPHTAVCFDAEAARIYAAANKIRVEPTPVQPWTEADLLRELAWTKEQLTAARVAGFPAATGSITRFDGDGVPAGGEGTWHPETVRQWLDRVRLLQPVGR